MRHKRITIGVTSIAVLAAVAVAGVDAGNSLAKSARNGAPPTPKPIPGPVSGPIPTPGPGPAPAPTPTTSTPTTSTTPAIGTAVGNSAATKGYAFRLSVNEQVPGMGTLKLTGSGTYSTPNRSGTGRFDVRGLGQNLHLQEIFLGSTFYVKEPPSVAAHLPGHKPWLKVDLSKAHGKYLKSLSSLLGSSSESNPTQFLTYLSDEANSVQDLGPATVDGVATTHYHASIDLAKAGTGQSAALHQAAQKVLQSLSGKIVDEHNVPADVWVDGSQLVRRAKLQLIVRPKGTGETVLTTTTIDLPSYGPQATPKPPPAGRTLNLLALLKSEGTSL